MKKVLILSLVVSLSLVSGNIWAQHATAPDPTPRAPASKVQDPVVPYQAAPATPAPAAPSPAAKAAVPASNFTISRMEIAGSVENREPVGIATTYPASQEKVYCFVELKDVLENTAITFVWTLGANEMDSVTQQINKSSRWRTWSNKSINGMKGAWKIDVQDAAGAVLESATFKVE